MCAWLVSLAGAVAVPSGIVLVADGLTSWSRMEGDVRVPDGGATGAKKLTRLGDGAVATAGQARIGDRHTLDFVTRAPTTEAGPATMAALVKHVEDGLRGHYGKEDLAEAPESSVSLLYAVHPDGDVARPFVARAKIRTGPDAGAKVWDNSESPFCSHWIGRTGLVRLLLHSDGDDVPRLGGNYRLMTLEHAEEFARFLVETTAEAQRLGRGVPDVGGSVTILRLPS